MRFNQEKKNKIYSVRNLPASLPPLTQIPKPWWESGGSLVMVIVLTVNSWRLSGCGPGDVWELVTFCCCCCAGFALDALKAETLAGLEAGVLLSFGLLLSLGAPFPKSLLFSTMEKKKKWILSKFSKIIPTENSNDNSHNENFYFSHWIFNALPLFLSYIISKCWKQQISNFFVLRTWTWGKNWQQKFSDFFATRQSLGKSNESHRRKFSFGGWRKSVEICTCNWRLERI